MFSIAAALFLIPSHSAERFQILHILINVCYYNNHFIEEKYNFLNGKLRVWSIQMDIHTQPKITISTTVLILKVTITKILSIRYSS